MKEWNPEDLSGTLNPLRRESLSEEERLYNRCKERSLYLLTGAAKTRFRRVNKADADRQPESWGMRSSIFQAAFGVGFSPPFGAEPLPLLLAFQAA